MKPLLDAHGVSVVAISKDTTAQVALHHDRDRLTLRLLADPKLEVIDRYGLRHRAGIQFDTVEIAGLPVGYPIGFKDMAIPTTVLVDEQGVVRWIDQADDYRVRGDVARIEAALEQVFGVARSSQPLPEHPSAAGSC